MIKTELPAYAEFFLYVTPGIICISAFIYGAINLFKEKIPFYFKIIVCGAGCYALQEISGVITYLCGGFEYDLTASSLGAFGCYFFLLSVNYGQLDGVVDSKGKDSLFAGRIALIAPLVLSVPIAVITYLLFTLPDFIKVIYTIVFYAPMVVASYYNLKHLIMKDDDFGFLKTMRAYNFWALVFYVLQVSYLVGVSMDIIPVYVFSGILATVTLFCMVVSAVKGAKKWKTLI